MVGSGLSLMAPIVRLYEMKSPFGSSKYRSITCSPERGVITKFSGLSLMPFSLFAKCKCRSLHRSSLEKGAHSMHRHDTGIPEPALPVVNDALVHGLDVIVGRRLPESPVGEVRGSMKQRVCGVFVHGRIVAGLAGFLYSHFPFPVLFVHGAIVSAPEA